MKSRLPLSKSRFSVWETCPFYASMVYDRGIRPPRSRVAAMGVTLHDFRRGVLTGEYDMGDCLSMLKDKADKDALAASIAMDAFDKDKIVWQYFEHDIRINGKGVRVKRRGVLRGILDRFMDYAGKIIVEDVKFGAFKTDDLFERRSYITLAATLVSPDSTLEFHRVWPRLGERDVYVYERTGSLYGVREDGEFIDLWDYLQQCILKVQHASSVPTPGPHCENWYGSPCYFLDSCPITHHLPASVSPEISALGGDVRRLLSSPEIASLDMSIVRNAYTAALQLKAMIDSIEGKVKEWCEANGDLTIGAKVYGWRESGQTEVDKLFVLRSLLSEGVPVEDIARAVNISASSLAKLPARHKDLRKMLLSMATWRTGTKKVFGGKYVEASSRSSV
jgi:hypothetical protein